MPFASVIAATDLTSLSAEVPARARLLARSPGARVLLAHVTPAARRRAAEADADHDAQTDTRARLQALAAASGAEEARLVTGEPGAALADLARAEDAGLIVLGLHRKRRVLDLLRLTTMERMVLAAPCPVLIAQAPAARPYRIVLAATDFSPASARALITAAQIAPDARFHALHALQVPLGRDRAAARVRAEAACAAFLALPGLPALAEPPEIIEGGVHAVLAYRLEELQPDLLCFGAGEEPEREAGREVARLDPYARDLMRAPPCDLLVARGT